MCSSINVCVIYYSCKQYDPYMLPLRIWFSNTNVVMACIGNQVRPCDLRLHLMKVNVFWNFISSMSIMGTISCVQLCINRSNLRKSAIWTRYTLIVAIFQLLWLEYEPKQTVGKNSLILFLFVHSVLARLFYLYLLRCIMSRYLLPSSK